MMQIFVDILHQMLMTQFYQHGIKMGLIIWILALGHGLFAGQIYP